MAPSSWIIIGGGVGGGVGVVLGAAIGYTVQRLAPPSKDVTSEETLSALEGNTGVEATTAAEPVLAAKTVKPAPHEVFEVPTHYLTASNELFTPLTQFHMLLQFKEEREAFVKVISAIDDVLGFEALLLTREPLSNLQLPRLAQQARNRTHDLLKTITAFSNELRPSPTKKKSMEGYITTVLENLDGIITHMHRQHAATTVYHN